jgi:hypothetical protein
MPDPIPDRNEALRRKLEDLEDAYGPAIRKAKATPGCTDIAVNEDGRIWTAVPLVSPFALECPPQELPIPPYALGALIGDGTSGTAASSCRRRTSR